MVYLRSCPKCLGDLTMGQDMYGSFISCLQCGFMRDVDAKPATTNASDAYRATTAAYSGAEHLPKAA